MTKTLTSYEIQFREYAAVYAENAVEGLFPKMKVFLDKRGANPEILVLLDSLVTAVQESQESTPKMMETTVKKLLEEELGRVRSSLVKIETDLTSHILLTPGGITPSGGPNYSFPTPRLPVRCAVRRARW